MGPAFRPDDTNAACRPGPWPDFLRDHPRNHGPPDRRVACAGEDECHIDGMRGFVDVRVGVSLAQVVEDSFLAHAIQERLRVPVLERLTGLDFPHLSYGRFAN